MSANAIRRSQIMPASFLTVTSIAIAGSLAGACRDILVAHWRRIVTNAWTAGRTLRVHILPAHAAIDWDNDVPPLPFLSGEVERASSQRREGGRGENTRGPRLSKIRGDNYAYPRPRV